MIARCWGCERVAPQVSTGNRTGATATRAGASPAPTIHGPGLPIHSCRGGAIPCGRPHGILGRRLRLMLIARALWSPALLKLFVLDGQPRSLVRASDQPHTSLQLLRQDV